ncbi:MAG TPA: nucleotide sugar dehydrogenase [Opitutaceae bacterium]
MIGFIGLTHLGLNYSLATAAKGFDVICYDTDPSLAQRLREGDFPIDEPGFRELYALHRGRITYTSDAGSLSGCVLVFYALDVLTNGRNESDLAPLTSLIEHTSGSLATGTIAVVMSQVRPGYMRALSERTKSGATLFYQVETLIFGAAVQRAMEPERFIIGALSPESPLPAPYREWLDAFHCPLLAMHYESAELAKIAINFFLVSAVSTTNTLAELCEAIGADWSEIAPALKLDKRIGPHAYLKPGLGIGGGNLERDLVTVQGLASEHGTEAGIVEAWQRNSAHAKFWAMRTLDRELLRKWPAARIAVWGLAYKQDTHSIKNSAAIELVRTLTGCEIHAYDPVAAVSNGLFPNLTFHPKALDVLAHADALVIMTPWREFSTVDPQILAAAMKGKLVVDPFGMLEQGACRRAGLRSFQIGRAS